MQRVCANHWCAQPFEILPEDLAFYETVSPVFEGTKELIPPPTVCPDCRRQRRMSWRKERYLHRRSCSLCGKAKVSIFPAGQSLVTYCSACYWSDKWDCLSCGTPFSSDLPFFDQFAALMQRSPLMLLQNMKTENSEYCHRIFSGRNNYLSFIALFVPENLIHTYYTMTCKDCTDVTYCQYCELCYELTDGEHCYHCTGRRLKNCNKCLFCEDCIGCSNCLRCKNLHQQEYCIDNRQASREEFEEEMRNIASGSWKTWEENRMKAERFFLTLPNRNMFLLQCENVRGANLTNCRDSFELYDFFESERMRYCAAGERSHDCMDCYGFGTGEHCYECVSFNGGNHNLFCVDCHESSDCLYCNTCTPNCRDCFGCIGLKHKQYCILNKQYTKEEYGRIVPMIIREMRVQRTWGELPSADMSPYAYNETVAQEFYPLTEETTQSRHWKWQQQTDEMPKLDDVLPADRLPDRIDDVSDDLLNSAILCAVTRRPFRVVKQELDFHRKMGLPLPRLHPDERHAKRMALRNPWKLWKRDCGKCGKLMETTYAPRRPEIVYCEECYLKEVY